MRVIYEKFPSRRIRCAATIGSFDGVHLGHQFILSRVVHSAKKKGIYSLAITFDDHPRKLLSRKYLSKNKTFIGHLNSRAQKEKLIEKQGIDYLWFIKANHAFFQLSGEEFLRYILRYFTIEEIIVGEDFRFGYKGKADAGYLNMLSQKYSFKLSVLEKIKKGKTVISSSLIRSLISSARFKEAKKLLGRPYYLEGKVIKGRGWGRKFGLPTANLEVFDYVVPQSGVYAATINIGNDRKYLCAVNIGTRPTFGAFYKKNIEAHIMDFNQDILGKKVKIFFLKKIREEKKFASIELLNRTIRKDIKYIISHFSLSFNI
jgi:riboflavin kinase/FMN adenylyltransferase